MAADFEVRDPIHGFVHPEPDEREIVDTAVFQRLRGLRQLAMAQLVYPGAIGRIAVQRGFRIPGRERRLDQRKQGWTDSNTARVD